MKKVQLLIIGATVFGTSASLNGDSMIIDSGKVPGAEYILSYKFNHTNLPHVSGKALLFLEHMQRMNIISDDGYIHLLPVAGILSEMMLQADIPVRFYSTVVKIKMVNDEFVVNISNENGIETIYAQYIIDTTSTGVMHNFVEECNVKKYVCGMLDGPAGEDGKHYSFIKGRFDNENFIEMPAEGNISAERLKLTDLWISLHQDLKDTRFVTCAQELAYCFDKPVIKKIMPGWMWIPSVSYCDVLLAFKEGQNCTTLI